MIGAHPRAEAIVEREAPRLARDAEALLLTIARFDYPHGMAIVEPAARSRDAWAIGSGHRLAAALNCSRHPAAVVVGAEARLRDAIAWHGIARLDVAIQAARVDTEATAIHETAHAIASTLDEPANDHTLDVYRRVFPALCEHESPRDQITRHDARWAAAYAVLVARAIPFRPRDAVALMREVIGDFADYGLDYPAIADRVAQVGADVPLRGLLTDATFIGEIRGAIPTDEMRRAIVADKLARLDVPVGDVVFQ